MARTMGAAMLGPLCAEVSRGGCHFQSWKQSPPTANLDLKVISHYRRPIFFLSVIGFLYFDEQILRGRERPNDFLVVLNFIERQLSAAPVL